MRKNILLFSLICAFSLCACNKGVDSNDLDNDYDGLPNVIDKTPDNNNYVAKIKSEYGNTIDDSPVKFSMDYRWFIDGDNTIYNKNLGMLGSLLINDIYSKNVVTIDDELATYPNKDPKDKFTFYKQLGCNEIEEFDLKNDNYEIDKNDTTNGILAHKKFIDEKGNINDIYYLTIAGTNGKTEWASNFDVGINDPIYTKDAKAEHPDWKNYNNHKGFDIAANRVIDKHLIPFIDKTKSKGKPIIFITGHSRGAATANIIGANFESNSELKNNYKTFTYTYATPNTTFDENYLEYRTIFNFKNDDDMVTKIPLEIWGVHDFGRKIKQPVELTSFMNNEIEDKVHDYDPFTQWEGDDDCDITCLAVRDRKALYDDNHNSIGFVSDVMGYLDAERYKNEMEETARVLEFKTYYKIEIQKAENPEDKGYKVVGYCSICSLFALVTHVMKNGLDILEIFEILNSLEMFDKYIEYVTYIVVNLVLVDPTVIGFRVQNAHAPITYYMLTKLYNESI